MGLHYLKQKLMEATEVNSVKALKALQQYKLE